MSRFEQYLGTNWDWDSAIAKHAEYDRVPYRPNLPWYSDNHIEDENQSVTWNREFVAKSQDAYVKARKALEKKRAALAKESNEIIKFVMWDELDRKLSDGDIDRYFSRFYDRYHSDGFRYMCSMIQAEIEEIREMDWFKDTPDYNYV